jgi:putative acyl-CoA dehydrogenase
MTAGLLEDASFNQSPDFGDVDLFSADRPLADAAARAGLDLAGLSACGKDYGAAETLDLGGRQRDPPAHIVGRATASISWNPSEHHA